MARKAFNLKSRVISVLRKLSYQSPARGEAMRSAKVAYGRYMCKACRGVFPPKEVQVDHIEPVVPISGWDCWDNYIVRLFCPVEQLQVLCRPCHLVKSAQENLARKRGKSGT